LEFVSVGEQDLLSSADQISDCNIVVDDSDVRRGLSGFKFAFDVIGVIIELLFAVGENVGDCSSCPSPGNRPLVVSCDFPGGVNRSKRDLRISDFCFLFINGCEAMD